MKELESCSILKLLPV
uniref:Uncharacterized protein n=1 Tax=Anguilla anguilla TaxID=7936 RepID=A0A0E9VVL5_ANGAN